MAASKTTSTPKYNSSPNSVRCDFSRLHRAESETPACHKRKLEQDTPKPEHLVTPSNKKRRGRRGLQAPARSDEPDETDGGDNNDSEASTLASANHYILRCGGGLPTPNASQNVAIADTVQSRESDSRSPSPAAADPIGDPESPSEEPAEQPEDTIMEDAEDTTIVARSRATSPQLPGTDETVESIEGPEQPDQHNDEGSAGGVADQGNPLHSPASTQMVPETPLVAARRECSLSSTSSLSSIDPSIPGSQDQQADDQQEQSDRGLTPIIGQEEMDQSDNRPNTPTIGGNDDIFTSDSESSTASTRSSRSSNSKPHFTHRPNSWRCEAQRLRRSRSLVTRNLIRSTALVNLELRRNRVLSGDLVHMQIQLAQARENADRAERRATITQRRRRMRGGLMMGVGMALGSLAWGVWAWVTGPEMEYVRRRRGQLYGV